MVSKLKELKKDTNVRRNYTLRLKDDERLFMQEMADQFCSGSLSDWMRIAALKWKPSEEDYEEVDE